MKHISKLVICILFTSFSIREIIYISQKSPTYDEHYYIGYGYSLLKTGDYRLRKDKTVLVPIIVSLPLFFLKNIDFSTKSEDWIKGDTRRISDNVHWALSKELYHASMFNLKFLYRNRISTDKLIFYARLPIVFISLLFGFFVFKWASELFGRTAGLFSLLLFTNCPNILAHSGLATEDLVLSCFMFLTIYFFWKYYKTSEMKNILFSGICLGLALNSKYTAVILLLILIILSVVVYLIQRTKNKKVSQYILTMISLFLFAFVVLLIFYRLFYIKEYFLGMKYCAEYIKKGQMCFLAGRYSSTGFWNYFLIAFLLKTPIALLIFLVIASIKTFTNLQKNYEHVLFLLLFPMLLFITASFSPMQIGHRHILPIYPFLFVFSSKIVTFKWKMITFSLLLWYLLSSFAIHPHYLAYFNEFAGGPANGYKYLVDQNIDWGQDLKGLKEYINKEKISDVILSYYGSGLPDYLNFNFQDLFSFGIWDKKEHVNSLYPSKEILAISVTNLQGLYLGKIGFDIFFGLRIKNLLQTSVIQFMSMILPTTLTYMNDWHIFTL